MNHLEWVVTLFVVVPVCLFALYVAGLFDASKRKPDDRCGHPQCGHARSEHRELDGSWGSCFGIRDLVGGTKVLYPCGKFRDG